MHFTKVQISELMRKHAEKENGLHDLMEIMLESMMVVFLIIVVHTDAFLKDKFYSLFTDISAEMNQF